MIPVTRMGIISATYKVYKINSGYIEFTLIQNDKGWFWTKLDGLVQKAGLGYAYIPSLSLLGFLKGYPYKWYM